MRPASLSTSPYLFRPFDADPALQIQVVSSTPVFSLSCMLVFGSHHTVPTLRPASSRATKSPVPTLYRCSLSTALCPRERAFLPPSSSRELAREPLLALASRGGAGSPWSSCSHWPAAEEACCRGMWRSALSSARQ